MNSARIDPMDTIPTLAVTGIANLKGRAEITAATAAEHGDAVDRDARFPTETFAAAREQRLLGTMVPIELGGDGASVSDVVDLCYMLGQACASSAMIFAMHQIMVAILLRHARNSAWHQKMLQRLTAEQLLLASSTTENQTGGDVRHSACVVERTGERMRLVKNATVMSYGAQADGILTTARRSADGAPSDQVLVAFLKDDYELERIVDWDTLGMRGTCSTGFTLRGEGDIAQILPDPYERIHTQHGAGRTFDMERRMDRHRGRCGCPRAALCARRRPRWQRPVAARRGPPNEGGNVLARLARQRCGSAAALRDCRADGGWACGARISDRDEPAQGQFLGGGHRDGDERAAGLRAFGLSQHRGIQHLPQSARCALLVHHDQQ
jgi:alkylation response protein AidB-like acyl-CoA dehydrogenase